MQLAQGADEGCLVTEHEPDEVRTPHDVLGAERVRHPAQHRRRGHPIDDDVEATCHARPVPARAAA